MKKVPSQSLATGQIATHEMLEFLMMLLKNQCRRTERSIAVGPEEGNREKSLRLSRRGRVDQGVCGRGTLRRPALLKCATPAKRAIPLLAYTALML